MMMFKLNKNIFVVVSKIFLLFALLFTLSFVLVINSNFKELIGGQKNKENFAIYFNNHNNLPSIVYKDIPYKLQFTIENNGQSKIAYDYDIKIATEGGTRKLETLILPIEPNKAKTITRTLFFNENFTKGKVIVEIAQLRRTIHFNIHKNL